MEKNSGSNRRVVLRNALGLTAAAACFPWENTVAAEPTANWPSWRGANRDGVLQTKLPSSLSSLKKQWSVSLSDSYSGPIVASGRVFTTETVNKRNETLIALDQQTGKEIWKREWQGAMTVPFFASANGSWIRSTPATDGNTVVVGGMRDVVAGFDAATGKEKWRIDFVKEHGSTLPSFGLVCSPLIEDGFAYMQAGGAVRKIDLETGDLVWGEMNDQGGMYGGAFSSPMVAEIFGTRQLVAQTRQTLCGISMDTGKVLWSEDIPAFRGMNILTPVVWNNKVFTSSYGGKGRLISLAKDGGGWSASTEYECKTEAYMSSPVCVGEYLFIHLRNKRFACLNLNNGEENWRTTPFGDYWSLVTDGERLLTLDSGGELRLIEADPNAYKLVDSLKVSQEPSWAHLGITGDQLFVRRQRGLDAYQWQS
ncbi:MAG: PQQ-binding-like beta-propeller repeat protein [Planctomycetota bacterium]